MPVVEPMCVTPDRERLPSATSSSRRSLDQPPEEVAEVDLTNDGEEEDMDIAHHDFSFIIAASSKKDVDARGRPRYNYTYFCKLCNLKVTNQSDHKRRHLRTNRMTSALAVYDSPRKQGPPVSETPFKANVARKISAGHQLQAPKQTSGPPGAAGTATTVISSSVSGPNKSGEVQSIRVVQKTPVMTGVARVPATSPQDTSFLVKVVDGYYCQLCKKTVKHRVNHLRTHSSGSEKSYPCKFCSVSFKFPASRLSHVIRYHCERRFLAYKDANTTQEEFKVAVDLLFQDIKVTPQGLGCPYCDKTIDRRKRADMKSHMLSTHQKRMVVKLERLQKTPGALKTTTKENAGQQTNGGSSKACKCKSCGATLPSKAELLKHTRFYCTKSEDSIKIKQEVLSQGLSQQRYKCLCGTSLISWNGLMKHKRRVCRLSKKGRQQRSKPSVSGPSGPSIIISTQTASITSNTHTAPTKCQFCDKTFSASSSLSKHKRTQHPEEFFMTQKTTDLSISEFEMLVNKLFERIDIVQVQENQGSTRMAGRCYTCGLKSPANTSMRQFIQQHMIGAHYDLLSQELAELIKSHNAAKGPQSNREVSAGVPVPFDQQLMDLIGDNTIQGKERHHCQCGVSLSSIKGLRNHMRKSCKLYKNQLRPEPATLATTGYVKCRHCEETFSKTEKRSWHESKIHMEQKFSQIRPDWISDNHFKEVVENLFDGIKFARVEENGETRNRAQCPFCDFMNHPSLNMKLSVRKHMALKHYDTLSAQLSENLGALSQELNGSFVPSFDIGRMDISNYTTSEYPEPEDLEQYLADDDDAGSDNQMPNFVDVKCIVEEYDPPQDVLTQDDPLNFLS